ncbi:MAG: NAD(P)/FAD-dependent oxidoreductase, partial [Bdellovibrionales bacterium]|nr:NAD(P)/FAD-dependent oxidoreductase [Bdellovibrionales bacterium]
MSNQKVDCVIIGAGMSGLASGIRLSMYNKKVLILEKHTISGGLNSYYARGKRKFDVGLHALTNFVTPKDKGKPFNKLMKQLRIPYEEFKLSPQNYSLIQFPEKTLKFTNEIVVLTEEIHKNFPHEVDGFITLLEHIKNFDEVNLKNETVMAKVVVRNFIKDEALIEMIFCPLLIYGSAWENDMDFSQFVIMFKSIFLEG